MRLRVDESRIWPKNTFSSIILYGLCEMSRKIYLMLSACSVLSFVAACGPMNDQDYQSNKVGSKAETSEDILGAQGSWNMVEVDQVSGDPVNLHSSARKQVNPANQSKRQFIPEERLADVQRPSGEEDVHYRLIRMEREMSDLRQDFDKLLPPLSNLIVADNQLDNTIKEIQARPKQKPAVPEKYSNAPQSRDAITSEALLDDRKVVHAAAPKSAPESKARTASLATPPAATPSAATQEPVALADRGAASAPATGKAVVKSIRMGEHPGKTRLVLDLTGSTQYRADLDNDEHLLTIELSEAGWSADSQKLLNHPLIKGYTTQASAGGGTILALELKKNVKVLGSSALKPNSQFGNRIYLDLAAS